MRSPFTQALLTYVHRSFSSWKHGCGLVVVLLMAVGVALFFNLPGNRHAVVAMQFLPLLCPFMLLAMHVKEQFVDSRANLLPGFRRVHATVAAAWALLLAVVVPAGFAWLVGWSPLGFVAVSSRLCFSMAEDAACKSVMLKTANAQNSQRAGPLLSPPGGDGQQSQR